LEPYYSRRFGSAVFVAGRQAIYLGFAFHSDALCLDASKRCHSCAMADLGPGSAGLQADKASLRCNAMHSTGRQNQYKTTSLIGSMTI
jgi:hypothetical protein